MKTCYVCQELKSADEFRQAARMKDGRCGKCRDCEADYSRRYRAAGPEISEKDREARSEFAAHIAATKYAKVPRKSAP